MGELALLFNDHFNVGCRLEVVWMDGWQRGFWFEETGLQWVFPSPNMPSGIPYIVGNEAAERFSFYGMKSILTIFVTKHLLDASGQLFATRSSQLEYSDGGSACQKCTRLEATAWAMGELASGAERRI